MSDYKIIDMENWKRATHCEIFRSYVEPQFCVTMEIDITNFYNKIKKKNLSFTFSFIYVVAKCANSIEEFRYRFLDGKVVLFDKIDTSFTYINPDTELFKVVKVPMQSSLEDYIYIAKETAINQKQYFTGSLGNDVFQFSAFPWASYTHISHTISGKSENATPLFNWGKYFERDGKLLMPFSVQVNHSFVDGLHIGKLANIVQDYLNDFDIR